MMIQADIVIFLVDARDGLTPLDQGIAQMLREMDLPLIFGVNKLDQPSLDVEATNFAELGFDEPIYLSAHHGRGRHDLLERIFALLGDKLGESPIDPVMKLAIVGKRNAGKSTLVNALAGDERVIVSEVPGTTRDAVDVRFEMDGHPFVAIDTAGVRKKKSMDDIDFYSYTRALASIRRADVVLYLIDSTLPVSDVDQKLCRAVADEYKPVVIAINKWDLAMDRASTADYADYLTKMIPQLSYAPITFMTAATGKNVRSAVEVALSLFKQATARATTGKLNQALQLLLEARSPTPKRGTKRVKILYATQVAVQPPTIVFFCNNPGAVTENYRRFMENRLREILPFKEIPVRMLFRHRHREKWDKGDRGERGEHEERFDDQLDWSDEQASDA
jgi:GTP-binding protein